MSKRIISICLTILMMLTLLPMTTFAEELNTPKLEIDSADATPGDTISVNISLKNNPGFVTAGITLAFDEGLTLVGATNGNTFPASLQLTMPKQLTTVGEITGSCNFAWSGTDIADSDIKDGVILTLRFKVSDAAEIGDAYNITVSARRSDFVDKNLQTVEMQTVQSRITIIDYTPGDVNDDGEISMLDTVMISRYVVDGCTYDPNGYAIRLNEKAADVNDDDSISLLDTVMISRYIVDGCKTDPNGYNITLKPSTKKCQHEMQEIAATPATCIEEGNIPYWYCPLCDKYFADVNGSRVTTLEDTVVEATGHTVVIDPAVPATYETDGLTEGSHCSKCWAIIVEQIVIPKLEPQTASITYKFVNNDTYLASQTINNPNPSTYIVGRELRLSNDIEVPGYTFLGWYDSFANNATQIKTISANETSNLTLYAHWERYDFSIQYESDLVSVGEDSYTVNQSKVLPSPQLDGYIFVGWSDGDGNIIRRIPAGTVGDKIYSANWMSERNKASAKKNLAAPYIFEDEETDTILFTYEIGQIENVPLSVIEDFGHINQNGVTKTVSKEYIFKTDTTLMDQFTETVANSTTNTAQWSLSNGWTDSVTVSENYLQENNLSETDVKTLCTTDESNWLVSSGSSGSSTTTKYNSSQDHDLYTATGNTKTYDTHDESGSKTHKQSADLKFSSKEYAEISGGGNVGAGHIEGKAGIELNQELDLGYEGSHTNSTASKTGTEGDEGYQDQTGSIKHTGTDTVKTGGWNRSSSYGGSRSVSNSESVSKTVSERIATEKGYGKTYILSGNQDETQGTSSSTTASNAYASAVTYGTEETTKETVTYSTSNTKTGYHRLVKAGIAHVFAVVGYDIKTASYFVNTFSIMDDADKYYNFEDYSYTTAAYDDNQISVIPFEVPYEVEEYVLSRVGETEGLEFNSNGIVTDYNGTEETVIIPEYHVVDNGDGTKKVVKVTGISSTTFKGNTDITGVQLSDYITSIPENAFEGCGKLSLINMPGVVSIGSSAFKDCAFDTVFLSQKIESLGSSAFENIKTFGVHTNKKSVAEGATNSGASNILIYAADSCDELNESQLTVSDETEIFVFCGRGNTFNNFSINSDADATVINRVTIQSDSGTPIKTSSSEVQFEQVDIISNSFSTILTNEDCTLYLYGENSLVASMGNTVLCKNINVVKTGKSTQNGVFTELETNGNILYTGSHSGDGFVKGNFVKITADEYNKYLNGVYTLTYDANGGTVSEISKTIYYGSPYGTLSSPVRDYYRFDGWYTDTVGGTKIRETDIVNQAADITLFAHWVENDVSDWIRTNELPSGAQITDTKWTYTLRLYKESASSSLSGWEPNGSAITGYGDKQGPVYSNPSGNGRKVTSEQYVSGYNKKTQYSYSRYVNGAVTVSGPVKGTWSNVYCGNYQEKAWSDTALQAVGTQYSNQVGGTFTLYGSGLCWYNQKTRQVDNTNSPIYSTRWYYQDPIYTYYYYQDNDLETTEADPTGQANVSNVVEWVRYRNK